MGRSTHLDPEVNVALQGTLDTFALPDVLRLLAATKKSGRLRITGGRGTGNVWVDEGAIGGIEAPQAPHATEPVDALFELLRFEQGSFTFDADVTHETMAASGDLETLLAAAETLLVEWREIESVVPSMDAWVRLRRDLGSSKVTIERSHWTTVVAVGSGVTVRRMSEDLCLAELPVSRAVRDLFELGLVDIEASAPAGQVRANTPHTAEPPAPEAADADIDEPIVEPVEPVEPVDVVEAVDAPAVDEPIVEALDTVDAPVIDAPALLTVADGATDAPLPTARPLRARRVKGGAHLAEPAEPERFVPLELPGHNGPGSYDPIDDAGQPVAVADLAAAFPGLANRAGDLTPDAALAEEPEVEPGEEQPVSRGRRLKFLSSAKS